MPNPWETIPLSDYENHMKLSSVMQLQTLNEMMKTQLSSYSVSDVTILGIAGGNGLEHIRGARYRNVYAVDINPSYLQEVTRRYPALKGILQCLCIDLSKEADKLPESEYVIANLLVEYIGYECFKQVIRCMKPKYVSCIIQINMEDTWVSDSPYLHVFDELEQVHHQMEENALEEAMKEVGYCKIKTSEHLLPNGKKLVQLDFAKQNET